MAWRVFYSYAHADEALRDKLGIYLKPLVIHKMITDWYDRKIDPGANWATEISDRLQSADLILLLVSENFLASDYCFGAEVETALDRLKLGGVKVVPILLKPCLWELSPFSELQIIPRDAKAIISWPSKEEAFNSVVSEIRTLVSSPPPPLGNIDADVSPSSLDLVRGQVRSHARLYERIRQRMSASSERTQRMEQVFQKMRSLVAASYFLLDDLVKSPSPGDNLAAIAILQVFANEQYLDFLVERVASGKPFVGYHAAKALHFAVEALDLAVYPRLLEAIARAKAALEAAGVGHIADRQIELLNAEQELTATISLLTAPDPSASQRESS